MKMIAALLFGLALCVEADAEEVYYSGNKLMEQCETALNLKFTAEDFDPVRYGNGMLCAGYVRGIADGYEVGAIDSTNKLMCLPEGVYITQVTRIVVKYGKENPEILHRPARLLVALALTRAFPCKR